MRAVYPPLSLSPPPVSPPGDARFFEDDPPLSLPAPVPEYPVRTISPRSLADLAFELYLADAIDLEDYLLLGFPSEINPAFDRTIGALTGRRAEPDRERDMIREWEARLADLRASSAPLPALIERAERTIRLLRWLETPALGKP
ncbi:hypothetical protein KL86APRO_11172 [uncultured Alphaproteobacteria bacterium]|uniref:Uncharacterized protein n=1 Tax=uncultured Alphaproteobacteria bacterium TaxID=91750 RepID=A0A212JJA2_9PROT|nr:hypothetical protein KL86APRO_11172 [uncultured Alphaproteobacteria bacterium]